MIIILGAAGWLDHHFRHLDFKSPEQVSLNTGESKSKGVFIANYEIGNLRIYDSSYQFPIDSIWREKQWHLILNKKGEITYEIYDPLDTIDQTIMVFTLKQNTSFNSENYYKNWYIMDTLTHESASLIRGVICMNGSRKRLQSLVIYRMLDPFNYNRNLERIADFAIKRKK